MRPNNRLKVDENIDKKKLWMEAFSRVVGQKLILVTLYGKFSNVRYLLLSIKYGSLKVDLHQIGTGITVWICRFL